jgi:antitoxin HicB
MNKDINYYLSLNYLFKLQKAQDGSWFIRYPDLKGCMSCGNTKEEAIRMGEDAKNAG